ncbi:MAG TPA: alpha/beta fold hydrolase [Rhizomicrobium sp.]|nr:alpha/beta fold hydrolase [Rhizomicrobium sp.]
MSTFVLVHGAFHGGWCWHKIVARLEAEGHTVFAPDMPGHGIDKTPIADVTLDDIVAKISSVLDQASEPVVLVGHSYGGTMITQASEARPEKIKKLVYLTAFMVPNGELTIDVAQADTENAMAGNVEFAADGKTITALPKGAREVFYGQCSDDDVALAKLVLGPEATAGFQTPIRTTAERHGSIPRVYIECLRDRAISIGRQRFFHQQNPCEKVFTLDTDHSPFFSMPDQLTDILVDL